MTHSARARTALHALTEADPALAALSLWCRHRDADELSTPAETVGQEIRYGPAFTRLAVHEQTGLAGHHVLHVALQHSDRMADMAARLGGQFQPDLWAIACDAIVNEAILQAGHALPRPALTLTRLLSALSEQGGLAEWDTERLYRRMADHPGAAGRARAQAEADGHQPDLQSGDGGTGGQGQDTGGGDGRDAWRAHMARAMAAGRAAGFGLGVLGGRLADLPRPRTPWEIVLRRLLACAVQARPSFSPHSPARAWLAGAARAAQDGQTVPPFQPRLRWQGHVPRVVLGLDCSASIDGDTLRLLAAEIEGLARRVRAELHLLSFDEAIHHDQALDPARVRQALTGLTLPQGGGTDFRPVIARAAEMSPSALVLLSDMDGPTGPRRPGFPVIWAAPQPDPPAAPFGHVLSLAG